MHQIALVHQPDTGAPIDRGGDRCVAQLRSRSVDQRLILRHLRFELGHHRLLRVGLLGGGVGRRGQLGVARQVDAGVGQIGLVLRLLRHRLIDGRLIGARVDARQHVTGVHVLAFAEPHLGQHAVDLRLDGHGGAGLHGAKPVQIDRHIVLPDRRHQHWKRFGRLAVGGGIPGVAGEPPPAAAQQRHHQRDQHAMTHLPHSRGHSTPLKMGVPGGSTSSRVQPPPNA